MENKKIKSVWKLCLCILISFLLVPQQSTNLRAEEEAYTYKIPCTSEGTELNQIKYTGWWSTGTSERWTNSTKWDKNNLPSFEVKFNGNRVSIIGQKDPALGIYKIQIDNLEAEEVDAYAKSRVDNVRIYEKTNLSEGEHTLKFYVQDKRNSAGTGNLGAQFVELEVGSSIEDPNKIYETIINDADVGDDFFNIQYHDGTWGVSTGYPDRFYNGDEHWFNFSKHKEGDPLPNYTAKFVGSGFELVGEKQPGLGIYNIYLDGELIGSADAYNSARISKTVLFSKKDIPHGEHTIKVVLSKTKNGLSKSVDGEIDCIKIFHKKIAVTSISTDASSKQVEKGSIIPISAKALPTYATNPKVLYSSDNPSIATVDENGNVTGVAVGKANIRISEKQSGVFTEVDVTVLPQGSPIVAFIGSTDIHHQQKDYDKYLTGANEGYESIAWKGDTMNTKIVALTKGKQVNNMKLTASDFTSSSGDAIPKENIDITWLKDTKANMGRGKLSSAPNEDFPDILYTKNPIHSDEKKVNSAWINVNIPNNVQPGVYTGTITLSADEMEEPIVFDYEYEVLDLELPSPKDTDTQIELWQHPFVSARYYGISNLNDTANANWFNEEHSAYLTSMMKEYATIGGRGVVATIVEEAWNHQSYDNDPSMVKWTKKADGSFTYDYTLFDKWINLNIDAGVIDPSTGYGQIKCYSIVPWENQVTYYDELTGKTVKTKLTPGSKAWEEQWKDILGDFIEHVDKKGWLDITYISMDERPISQLEPAVELINSIESKSGKQFKISSAMNFEAISDYDFLDKIDDISIGIGHIKENDAVKKLADHRNAKGLLTTTYNCTGDAPNSNTISMPVESDWILWYSMSQNLSGYMRWSYDGWTEKPLENVYYKYWEAGDPFFIYPGDKGTDIHFRSSPRFERLKEGIRDVNKAKYLQSLSNEYETSINELVDGLKRPTQGVNKWGATLLTTEENRQLVIDETKRMKDGINTIAKDYIKNRNIDIKEIVIDNVKTALTVGETTTIEYTINPENATNKVVYFSSSDTSIASVDKDGNVLAKAPGSVVIKVSSMSDKTDPKAVVSEVSINVSEQEVEVPKIEVDIDKLTLYEGEEGNITIKVNPENTPIYWWSGDESIATVEKGKVKAIKEGTTVIFVSDTNPLTRKIAVTKEIKITVIKKAVLPPKTENNEEGKASTVTPSVKSGDTTNLSIYVVLAVLSLYAIRLECKKRK